MKNGPDHFPDWIERATVPKRGGTVTHVLATGRRDARLPRRARTS